MSDKNIHRFDETMGTDVTYQPNKAYAWGAAAQIDMLAQADDPALWEMFFAWLRKRNLFDELHQRMSLDADGKSNHGG